MLFCSQSHPSFPLLFNDFPLLSSMYESHRTLTWKSFLLLRRKILFLFFFLHMYTWHYLSSQNEYIKAKIEINTKYEIQWKPIILRLKGITLNSRVYNISGKAKLLQEGVLFRTQFPSLGIFKMIIKLDF